MEHIPYILVKVTTGGLSNIHDYREDNRNVPTLINSNFINSQRNLKSGTVRTNNVTQNMSH